MKSRRNFLKIAGLGLTGSVISTVATSAANNSLRTSAVKIGVLLPGSTGHPHYSGSFLNGLRLAVNSNGLSENSNIEIIAEPVNNGSSGITGIKAEQLITENNINILVGLINSEVAIALGELVENAQIPTLIANAGENYLVNKARANPYLFFNSLNLFQNSFLAGKHAVEKFGKHIAVVTSMHDSGYDSLYAFYKGVELAGGVITETWLKNEKDVDFISKTLESIKKDTVNGIYVLLNGDLADDFFRTAYLQKFSLPILTTSFASDENRLVNLGGAANGIQSFQTWTKNLNNHENQVFVSAYKKKYSKEPDQFGFLGYETGLILKDSISKCQYNISGNNLTRAMSECKINSPGGEISVNENSGQVTGSSYLCEIKLTERNSPQIIIKEKCKPVSEVNESFASLDTDLRSGFISPYLFG